MLRRTAFTLGLALLVVEGMIAILLAITGIDAMRQVHTLRTDLGQLETLQTKVTQQPAAVSLATLDSTTRSAAAAAAGLQSTLQRWSWIVELARHSPEGHAEWAQVNGGLSAVVDLARAFREIGPVLSPLTAPKANVSLVHTLATTIEAQRAQLAAASLSLADTSRELALVKGHEAAKLSSGRLTTMLGLVTKGPLVLRSLSTLPDLLGFAAPQHFLVVAQNPADLRPTGGFMGSWGIVTVSQGQIRGLDYRAYYNWEQVRDPNRAWPVQTAPMQTYLGYCCIDMQDANWYPDFPTTALVLETFSEADQPLQLNGIIAFDPTVIQGLLQVTGPVSLSSLGVTVTSQNFVSLANYFGGRGAAKPPKAGYNDKQFLVDVAHVLVDRLKAPSGAEALSLVRFLPDLLAGKHLLLYFNNPVAEQVVDRLDWGGKIVSPSGDYVMLVDSSMSDNKVDTDISRSIHDTVHIQADGSDQVELKISWSNHYPFATQPDAGQGARIPPTTAFRDFFRVYLPPGTVIESTRGVTALWPSTIESGHVVFQGFLTVDRLATASVTLRYRVPAAVIPASPSPQYRITIQTQPGIAPVRWDIVVNGPQGGSSRQIHALVRGDETFDLPVSGVNVPKQPAAPTWDPYCAALDLTAGLKGPQSKGRLEPPPNCAASFQGS